MSLSVHVNGQAREFGELVAPARLDRVIEGMGLKADRVAVEHNGLIAPRVRWTDIQVQDGDKLEVVHFVGGGCYEAYGAGGG